MQSSIKILTSTEIENIVINHQLVQTMADEKICQTISKIKLPSSCYICKPATKPSSMNNITEIQKNNIESSYLKLGISPLHLYINSMECILHISYKLEIKLWSSRGLKNKKIIKNKKAEVQKDLKQGLRINVDKPLPGETDNSNTRNIARKFINEYSKTSKITEEDEELIECFT